MAYRLDLVLFTGVTSLIVQSETEAISIPTQLVSSAVQLTQPGLDSAAVTQFAVTQSAVTQSAEIRPNQVQLLAQSQATPQPNPSEHSPQANKWLETSLIPLSVLGMGLLAALLVKLYRSQQARSRRLEASELNSNCEYSQSDQIQLDNQVQPENQANQPEATFNFPGLENSLLVAESTAIAPKSAQSLSSPAAPQLSSKPGELSIASASSSDVNLTTRLAKVDIVAALMAELPNTDAVKRRKAIWDLGQHGDSRAIQPLVELLIDSDSQQRSLILAAITEISSRTLTPMNRALMLSLQDESVDVRKNAIRDITRVYELMAQASQLLQYAASDSDTEVQETARWALNQLNRMRSPE